MEECGADEYDITWLKTNLDKITSNHSALLEQANRANDWF